MRCFHALMLVGILALLPFVGGCSTSDDPAANVVIVYSSVDEEFARPLADKFEEETGIEVKLVSDTEKAKSSGLLNLLLEEQERPQCDVFLSEDPVWAAVLNHRTVPVALRHGTTAEVFRPRTSLDRHVGAGSRPAG